MKLSFNKPGLESQIEWVTRLMGKALLFTTSRWQRVGLKKGGSPRFLLFQAGDSMRERLGILDTTKLSIEKRFMEVAAGMEALSQTGENLIKESENLICLAGGLKTGSGAIQAAIDTLSPSLAYLHGCQAETEQLKANLDAFGAQIKATLQVEQTFQRTVEPLRYIQTLFRVESASCDDTVRGMFLALVAEIEKLHQQVNGTFREQFVKLRDTESKLQSFTSSLNIELKEQKRVTVERSRDVELTLHKLRRDEALNQEIHLKLGRASREVSEQTGSLVMALQYQDIISQKIEHIRHAIQEMAKSCEAVMNIKGDPARGIELRFIQQAGAVASSQISHAEAELESAQSKISNGVKSMTTLLDALDKECVTPSNVDEGSIGAGEVVQRLLDVFEEVSILTSKMVASTKRAHHDIKPVGDMTSNFTAILTNLSHEMHLIGLNAQIQASLVGAGTGLEVLSSQASSISTATTELSEQVSAELDALQGGLNQVIKCFQRLHVEGSSLFERLQGARSEETRKLHEHRDACLSILIKTGELLGKLHEQAGSLANAACFEEVSGSALSALKKTVEEVSRHAGEWADELGVTDQVTEKTQEFLERYTMTSERAVHDEVMSQFTGNKDSQTAHEPFGEFSAGEIDLFEPMLDQPITPGAVVPSESRTVVELAGVDLWLDEPVLGKGEAAGDVSQVTLWNTDKAT